MSNSQLILFSSSIQSICSKIDDDAPTSYQPRSSAIEEAKSYLMEVCMCVQDSNMTQVSCDVSNTVTTTLCKSMVASLAISTEVVTQTTTPSWCITSSNNPIEEREMIVYSVFIFCIGLCVLFGLIALLSCLYIKKKSRMFTPHGDDSNLYGSRLGRQLSLIQNTLTDGEEDTRVSDGQTDEIPTYSVIHKKSKRQPLPDIPPPIMPLDPNNIPDSSINNDYSVDTSKEGISKRSDEEHMYQELPDGDQIDSTINHAYNLGKKQTSLYEVPVSVNHSEKPQISIEDL